MSSYFYLYPFKIGKNEFPDCYFKVISMSQLKFFPFKNLGKSGKSFEHFSSWIKSNAEEYLAQIEGLSSSHGFVNLHGAVCVSWHGFCPS